MADRLKSKPLEYMVKWLRHLEFMKSKYQSVYFILMYEIGRITGKDGKTV